MVCGERVAILAARGSVIVCVGFLSFCIACLIAGLVFEKDGIDGLRGAGLSDWNE